MGQLACFILAAPLFAPCKSSKFDDDDNREKRFWNSVTSTGNLTVRTVAPMRPASSSKHDRQYRIDLMPIGDPQVHRPISNEALAGANGLSFRNLGRQTE
jgi:hypothetical protein